MATQNEYFPQSLPHPGKTLIEKLEEMGMNSKEFAECTNIQEPILIGVLKGSGSITPDLAERFEKSTRIPIEFWLNSQRIYDEFMSRKGSKKKMETFATI